MLLLCERGLVAAQDLELDAWCLLSAENEICEATYMEGKVSLN